MPADDHGLRPAQVAALVVLAAIWGASFLFMKVALRDVGPLVVVAARTTFGFAGLLAWFTLRRGPAGVRAMLAGIDRRDALILSLVGAAIPFVFLAWAETRIDSSLAGLLNGSLPLVTALLAVWLDPASRPRGRRALGLLIGFVGVGIIAGGHVGGAPLGVLATFGAVLGYAAGVLFASHRLTGVEPPAVALVQTGLSAAMTLPVALLLDPPDHMPPLEGIGSLLALGIGGTGIAWCLYYWLLAETGPHVSVTVTYLAPIAALFYGAVLLDEHITVAMFIGAGLVLAGEALIALRGRRPLAPSIAESVAPSVP